MNYRRMTPEDIKEVLPLYIDYYNNCEGCMWTEQTASKRIHQVLSMEDAYGIILGKENHVIGFAMGYFKQYDDIVSYMLDEIVIAREHQNKGLGRLFLAEIERQAQEQGASCVELQAVNDEMHERYYGKAGYHNAENFVLKVKWFE